MSVTPIMDESTPGGPPGGTWIWEAFGQKLRVCGGVQLPLVLMQTAIGIQHTVPLNDLPQPQPQLPGTRGGSWPCSDPAPHAQHARPFPHFGDARGAPPCGDWARWHSQTPAAPGNCSQKTPRNYQTHTGHFNSWGPRLTVRGLWLTRTMEPEQRAPMRDVIGGGRSARWASVRRPRVGGVLVRGG